MSTHIAIDIGASSGRVMLGTVGEGGVTLEAAHRFPNGVVEFDGALRWDIDALLEEILTGLGAAAALASAGGVRIASIGIDTWAVDYGLVDASGALRHQPFSYRDPRSQAGVERVHARVDPTRLHALNGLQFLPFNTLYQLAVEEDLRGVQALLIPDLIAFRLTGRRRTELTNASTTGLLDPVTGAWSAELFDALDLPAELFPPVVEPGRTIGTLLPAVAARTGLPPGTPVVAVGSHDTASAVAAVPAQREDFAYISSGTWSLVGLELERPVLTEAARAANFTNERGVDGTVRFLRNVGGLWLLSECLRSWAEDGSPQELPALLRAAAALPPGGPLIDPDDAAFVAPGGMPGRIQAAVAARGGEPPAGPAAITRCILESLAAGYAATLDQAERLSGRRVSVVHVMGGGSQNELLCRLTAQSTGRTVLAGPVEATALGNLLIQARAAGTATGGLRELRSLLTALPGLTRHEPAAAVSPGGTP